ncbi:MAG: hypothetical protein ACK552_06115 [Microcystis sp.]
MIKYPEPFPLRRRGRLFSVSSLLGNNFVLVKGTFVSPSKGILERIKVEDAGTGGHCAEP